MVCSAYQATELVSCLLLAWPEESCRLAHTVTPPSACGKCPSQGQCAIAQGLEHPRAKKAEVLALVGWEKATPRSRPSERCAGAFGIHGEGVCPCSTSRGACLVPSGAPETPSYPRSTQVPQVGFTCRHNHPCMLGFFSNGYQWNFIWMNCTSTSVMETDLWRMILRFQLCRSWNYPIAYPGSKVLPASETWTRRGSSLRAFQIIRVFSISVMLMLLCVGTCVC